MAKSGTITSITTQPAALSLGFVAAVIFTHTLLNPEFQRFQRMLAFAFITPLLIFLIPPNTDLSAVFYRVSVFTSGLVILAIPTLFVGELAIGPLAISSWHTTTTLPVLGLEYPPLVSIFSNPNTLSFVCAISAISLLRQIEFDTVSRILFAINVGGLYLSGARASILAFLAAIALLTVYKVLGTWATVTSSIAGLCIVFALPVLAIWELVPINLAGRQDLWRASYYAFLEAPLYGHGPSNLGQVIAPYVEKTSRVGVGPHNSFIAIFLIGGVITGLAYLYFLFESFRVSACFLDEPNGIVIHLLLVATLIMAMFSGSTVFGLSTVSVVSALVAGYALSQVRTQTHFQS